MARWQRLDRREGRNGDPSSLVQPMRALLQDLDPDVPMSQCDRWNRCRGNAVAQPRLYLVLIACFAGTAMLLSAIGLYGVLAYAVGQRTREIGIRLALGAKRGEVLRMVMTQAGRLAVAGVAHRPGRRGARQPRAAIAAVPGRADRHAHLRPGWRRAPDWWRWSPAGSRRAAPRELIRSPRSVMIDGWVHGVHDVPLAPRALCALIS